MRNWNGKKYIPAFLYFVGSSFIFAWWLYAFYDTSSPTQQQASNREPLLKALSGDYALMVQLMEEWQTDPQVLQRAESLAHDLNQPYTLKLFPQTYAAVSILSALVPLDNMVALPAGFKKNHAGFEKVSLEIDRWHGERLFLLKPDFALVAAYSDPAVVARLKSQNIPLLTLETPTTFVELLAQIKQVGQAIGREAQAELTTLFMQAALNTCAKVPKGKIVYVEDHGKYVTPNRNTLFGDLLNHLHINEGLEGRVMTREKLFSLKPDQLIIASNVKMQHYPTQWILLAYFDLVEALV